MGFWELLGWTVASYIVIVIPLVYFISGKKFDKKALISIGLLMIFSVVLRQFFLK